MEWRCERIRSGGRVAELMRGGRGLQDAGEVCKTDRQTCSTCQTNRRTVGYPCDACMRRAGGSRRSRWIGRCPGDVSDVGPRVG